MSSPNASIITARSRSGRVPKMPAKRLLAESVNRFDNDRPRKVVAFNRDYPKSCGRDCDVVVGKSCTFTGGADVAHNEPFSDADYTNAANVEAPIEAVPLRSVNPIHLSDTESSDVVESQNMVPVLVEGRSYADPISLSEGDDYDEEICILSAKQWHEQKLSAKRTCVEAKVSIGKTDNEPATRNVVKTQEKESCDLMGSESCNTGHDQLIIDAADYDCARASSGGIHLESGTMASEVCESPRKLEQDELLEKCTKDDNHAIKHNQDLINLSIAEHDHPMAVCVKETLELFDKYYQEFLRKSDKTNAKNSFTKATNRLKVENRLVHPEKPFGHIPGIQIGDTFRFRCEMLITGLHCEHVSGIYSVDLDGKKIATSIVHSGRYKNHVSTDDVLIYCGQGGYSRSSKTVVDQKLKKGNLALVNAMEMGYPVRVTYKSKCLGSTLRKDKCEYVYDGLYNVKKYWEDIDKNCIVFKFELHRLSDQAKRQQTTESSRKLLSSIGVCVLDDISNGKENAKIPVLNSVDGDMPSPFSYMTGMVYPKWTEQTEMIGCDCINGCSDLHPCHCVMKNGGEIPYNEEGSIVKVKSIVHECGPQCKCPPTCMNRVSQHGPKHKLEVFKTELMGWGLRSRSNIPSGSFICEYVGELLQDSEADERSNDEYLFDIFNDNAKRDGLAIDAAVHGNIGRFINHHCSPNLYAQEVLYDHDDKRMPHIMFFASKNIPALKELSYDYNYQIDTVCDKSGNIKKKYCKCGSSVCTGRLY